MRVGVDELNPEKLSQLVELKHHAVRGAIQDIGAVENIREVFVGVRKNLYSVCFRRE